MMSDAVDSGLRMARLEENTNRAGAKVGDGKARGGGGEGRPPRR